MVTVAVFNQDLGGLVRRVAPGPGRWLRGQRRAGCPAQMLRGLLAAARADEALGPWLGQRDGMALDLIRMKPAKTTTFWLRTLSHFLSSCSDLQASWSRWTTTIMCSKRFSNCSWCILQGPRDCPDPPKCCSVMTNCLWQRCRLGFS